MVQSRQHRLRMDGGQVKGHAVPLEAYAELLTKWNAALGIALPRIVESTVEPSAQRTEMLRQLEPYTAPPEAGSSVAPWGLGMAKADEIQFVEPAMLDGIADAFEQGIADFARGVVANWMTGSIARATLDIYSALFARGISIWLGDRKEPLDAAWSQNVRAFLESEEHGKEADLQVLGNVVAVNITSGYLILESTNLGRIQMTLPKVWRREACEAMAAELPSSVLVHAGLRSDGTLTNAKLREFRSLPKRDYVQTFAELWGVARDAFSGAPRDEDGIPDPDPEPTE